MRSDTELYVFFRLHCLCELVVLLVFDVILFDSSLSLVFFPFLIYSIFRVAPFWWCFRLKESFLAFSLGLSIPMVLQLGFYIIDRILADDCVWLISGYLIFPFLFVSSI